MSFSKRIGVEPDKAIQFESVDYAIRESIWNAFYIHIFNKLKEHDLYALKYSPSLYFFCESLWANFLILSVHKLDVAPKAIGQEIHNYLQKCPWNKLYDFIEFTISYFKDTNNHILETFTSDCNKVLIREGSAYRIIDNLIVPIISEIEISELKDALSQDKFKNVNLHLRSALEQLSDKINPDYRNSIKESISSIETLCREITGETTLGKALKKFENSGIIFNSQFKEALEKLYAYTNNKETGIRHALLETPQPPGFDEAKFFLIASSAFINYLISKTVFLPSENQ